MGCAASFLDSFESIDLEPQVYYMHQPRGQPLPSPPGVVGLQNLGNTCFMNSAVQCLVSTTELVDYFSRADWRAQINRGNPLGRQGDIAEAFGDLLTLIWRTASDTSSTAEDAVNNSPRTSTSASFAAVPVVSPYRLRNVFDSKFHLRMICCLHFSNAP